MIQKKLILALVCGALSVSACVINASVPPTGAGQDGTATNNDLANKAVTGVTLSQSTLVIQVKKSAKVQATVRYADGSSDSRVSFSSDDTTRVAINPTTGEITGVTEGTATVRAQSMVDANKFALIAVTVKEGVIEDLNAVITPENPQIGINETVQLQAEIKDSSGRINRNGSWSSSDSTIAFVNNDGLVSGRKRGRATITFTSDTAGTVRATTVVSVDMPSATAAPAATPAPTQATSTPAATPEPSPSASAN
jgi:uncharacterized protein YjdB